MFRRRQFLLGSGAAAFGLAAPAWARITPRATALPHLTRLEGIDGPPVTWPELRERPVLITFWASWCPPCRDEFRHINRVVETYGETDLLVVGVNVFEDYGGLSWPAKRARFLRQTAPAFRLLEGTAETRTEFGGIDRIPTVMLFDARGRLAFHFIHERDAAKQHITFDDLQPTLDRVTTR